jgi:hypothetical protein
MKTKNQTEPEARELERLSPAEFDRLHKIVKVAKPVVRKKRWYDTRSD